MFVILTWSTHGLDDSLVTRRGSARHRVRGGRRQPAREDAQAHKNSVRPSVHEGHFDVPTHPRPVPQLALPHAGTAALACLPAVPVCPTSLLRWKWPEPMRVLTSLTALLRITKPASRALALFGPQGILSVTASGACRNDCCSTARFGTRGVARWRGGAASWRRASLSCRAWWTTSEPPALPSRTSWRCVGHDALAAKQTSCTPLVA